MELVFFKTLDAYRLCCIFSLNQTKGRTGFRFKLINEVYGYFSAEFSPNFPLQAGRSPCIEARSEVLWCLRPLYSVGNW